MKNLINILGVGVDSLSRAEALIQLQGFVEVGTPHQVVTINPELVVIAQKSHLFREVINGAALNVADGVGLILASKLLGTPLRERIPGVDLLWDLARVSVEKGYRLFLLGGDEGVAEAAGKRLHRELAATVVVDTYAGSPAPEDEKYIIERIVRAAPHFLFVAYGAPQQELWISRNLALLGYPFA